MTEVPSKKTVVGEGVGGQQSAVIKNLSDLLNPDTLAKVKGEILTAAFKESKLGAAKNQTAHQSRRVRGNGE